MVKRRKFVIGLGALVAGSGAALGTGASVNSTMSRTGDVDVVNDSNGLLALSEGTEDDSDVIDMNNGELTIDFSGINSGGVNVNSKYQIGSLSGGNNNIAVFDKVGGGPTTHNAFQVVNNDDVRRDVTVEYDTNSDPDGSFLYMEARPLSQLPADARGPGPAPIMDLRVDSSTPTDSFSYSSDTGDPSTDNSIDSGNGIGVSILVDTTGSSGSGEDLSGTLTISGGTPP